MSIFEMLTLETSSSKVKVKRQKFEMKVLKFKVSRFQVWGDKLIWEMSTFEMLTFEISSAEEKGKQRRFEVKILMLLYEVTLVRNHSKMTSRRK